MFVHIHSSLQLININIDCKYTQYNIRKCFSKFVCICFWSDKVTCMGRGHNKSNIRPVIGYSGPWFPQAFFWIRFINLGEWINSHSVCFIGKIQKEIRFHQRNYVRQTLLDHGYQKVENKNSKPQSIYKHWHTKAIIQMPDIVFTVSNPWRVYQQFNNPYLHKALSKQLHNKPD